VDRGLLKLLGMNKTLMLSAVFTIGVAAPGCVVGATDAPLSYQEFKAKYVTVAGTRRFYDSDQPLATPHQLKQLYAQYALAKTGGESISEATVNLTLFGDDKWSPADAQNLTYCVSDAFGAQKPAVVDALATAGDGWHSASNGAVHFAYVAAQDASCTNANTAVTFDVIPNNAASGPYAVSFFPSQARASRELVIYTVNALDPNSAFPLAGVLRHELGHTLGLRHETTRTEAVIQYGQQCFENVFNRPLTAYDDMSVMTTPACMGNAIKNKLLVITSLDAEGIQKLYNGAPGTPPTDPGSPGDGDW
jgi:serine protease